MASLDQNPPAFHYEDDELEDTDDTDIDDDEDDDVHAPPPLCTIDLDATAAFNPKHYLSPDLPPAPPQNGSVQVTLPTAVSFGEAGGDLKLLKIEERRPPPCFEESRRLFQRLWTDDDEIKILTGFLEFTSSRGTQFASHQYDTGPFYEQIRNQLQLDFNKNQLIEKLRRLKKKYRNTANRMANHGPNFSFKSPHEKATYEIARKIWSAGIKRSRESDEDDRNPYSNITASAAAALSSDRRGLRRRSRKGSLDTLPAEPAAMLALPSILPPPRQLLMSEASERLPKIEVQTAQPAASVATSVVYNPSIVEETVKSCLSPIFKDLLSSAVSAPFGLGVNFPPLMTFGRDLGSSSVDERWKKQQVLELEVYLKRVELIRDQIKSMLEELKSSQSGTGS